MKYIFFFCSFGLMTKKKKKNENKKQNKNTKTNKKIWEMDIYKLT